MAYDTETQEEQDLLAHAGQSMNMLISTLYDELDREFGFSSGRARWALPPYHGVSACLQSSVARAAAGETVVCLIPARSDTHWWHSYAGKGEVRFIRGRVKFDGHRSGAPFPSCVVVFRGHMPTAEFWNPRTGERTPPVRTEYIYGPQPPRGQRDQAY
jgi:hypothetical protein